MLISRFQCIYPILFWHVLMVVFSSCDHRKRIRQENDEIMTINKANCLSQKSATYQGIVDSVFLNSSSEYVLELRNGSLEALYAVEQGAHILQKGDSVLKKSGTFSIEVNRNGNTFFVDPHPNFDCNYWDTLSVLSRD